jgi:serine/threonine protein kinase
VGGGGPVSIRERRLIGDRYELEALIGKGGIGEVWRARHVALNSRVAVKFLQLHASERESPDSVKKRRFTAEAQITAQLKTPHAVQVFDFGVTDWGQPYLVMELLEGETLGRRLERVKRLGAHETVHLLGQAARALHRAHQLGIVHRDFKPDNVVVCADDEGRDYVKVLDFGVAKIVGALEAEVDASQAPESAFAPSFTRTGSVLGTPLYMAPEQVRDAAEVDARTDLWAFGIVAFECLTGRPPFTASSIEDLFDRIVRGLHPSAHFLEETVPESFDAWFDIACAVDPAKRFMNASIAWKQLAVALNVETVTSGADLSLSSGERSILPLPSRAVDFGGTLDDDTATTLRRVIGRTSTGRFTSMRRLPVRNDTATAPPAPPSAQATSPLARSAHDEPERGRTPSRAWIGLAGVLVVVAALAVWRASVSEPVAPAASSPPAAAPGEAPPASVTSTVAMGAAAASLLATAQASSPPATTPVLSVDRHAVPPSSVQPPTHGVWRPTPVASHAAAPASPSAAPSVPVVTSATSAPTQPPPLSSTTHDPLSERQ